MDDGESSDLDTKKSLGDTTTTTELDDSLVIEKDLESQPPTAVNTPQDDGNHRRKEGRGIIAYSLDGCDWRSLLIAKLAKSCNFDGSAISFSDIENIAIHLRNNGIYKNGHQIQEAFWNIRKRHFKMGSGLPRYVKTKADEKAFNVVAAKMTKYLEGRVQKRKKNHNQTRRNIPRAIVKPPSATDSDVIARLDDMSKHLLQVSNNFAVFRSEVLKALPKATGPKRSEKTIKFTEGNTGQVLDELQPFLQLKNSTVTSTKTQNKYILKNFVGSGTFSVVFRAVEENNGTSFAIKIVKNETEAVEEKEFMNCLAASGRKCNEYCCFPFDSFDLVHDGKRAYCFVMELLRKDMFTVIFEEKMQFSLHSIVQTLAQAFSALSFINSVGFIHSDVKPENIMMFDYNLRKIGDKELIVEPRIKIIDANALIPIRHVYRDCQTTRYRCPEVLLGTDFDESIDTWSMGVIATEMIIADFLFDFEYDVTDRRKAAPQVQLIEKVIGPLPESLWEICNFSDLKNAMDDSVSEATTLKEILTGISSHGFGIVLNAVLPSLLHTDPYERPKPHVVAERLAEFLPVT